MPNFSNGRRAAQTLFTGFSSESGLFEQFAGFFGLEEIDLSQYADRKRPIDVILGRERTQRTQVVKQADIVALLDTAAGRMRYVIQAGEFPVR